MQMTAVLLTHGLSASSITMVQKTLSTSLTRSLQPRDFQLMTLLQDSIFLMVIRKATIPLSTLLRFTLSTTLVHSMQKVHVSTSRRS